MKEKLKEKTEKQIESEVLRVLNNDPDTFAFKVNTIGIYDERKKIYRKNRNPYVIPGTSDIIGICDGLFFALEVKKPSKIEAAKNEVYSPQSLFLRAVSMKGGIGAYIASAEQVPKLLKFMKDLRLTHPDPHSNLTHSDPNSQSKKDPAG